MKFNKKDTMTIGILNSKYTTAINRQPDFNWALPRDRTDHDGQVAMKQLHLQSMLANDN